MRFVRGLTADLQPLVEGSQTDPTEGGLYQQVLARASAVGDAHCGMVARFNQKPKAKTEVTTQKTGRHLLAIDHVPPSKKNLPPVFPRSQLTHESFLAFHSSKRSTSSFGCFNF